MLKPLTAKQQYWFYHISAAQHNGQSLSAYAEAHQLNVKALYNWRWTFSKREIKPSTKQTSFVKVQRPSKAITSIQAPIIVILPNGVRLQFKTLTSQMLALLQSC